MLQAHIKLDDSINCKYAILPGDPARLDHIKKYLDDVVELAYNREYRSLKGKYKDIEVLAISTGIGGSSAAIAIEELNNIGVKSMIRIGSCGALQTNIKLGDLILAEGAIRDDGTSKAYVDSIYPAVCDHELLQNCIDACNDNDYRYHVGIVHSHESFYIEDNSIIEAGWSKKGVLGSDMETATLFTVGKLKKIKCASILNNVVEYGNETADSINSYTDGASLTQIGEANEILCALEALYRYDLKQK